MPLSSILFLTFVGFTFSAVYIYLAFLSVLPSSLCLYSPTSFSILLSLLSLQLYKSINLYKQDIYLSVLLRLNDFFLFFVFTDSTWQRIAVKHPAPPQVEFYHCRICIGQFSYVTIFGHMFYVGWIYTPNSMVLRPLPNHVKEQRLFVHILYYILFSYLDEMLKTMFECEYTSLTTVNCLPSTYLG